jgi:predicted 2-oxoglutarate/Fe(II)-dependent dioxygenase YbiX
MIEADMSAAVAAASAKPIYAALYPGDPAPWFHQRSVSNPRFSFDTVGGRYIVLCFVMSARDAVGKAAIDFITEHKGLFDDEKLSIFPVSMDPEDESTGRIQQILPGVRPFWDFDGLVGRLYGALPGDVKPDSPTAARRFWIVLDPTLRVRNLVPMSEDGADRAAMRTILENLPATDHYAGLKLQAPVLYLPNVFEPELCQHLIGLYEKHGGEESGFMREVNGKTTLITDHNHKRRKDYNIEDQQLIQTLQGRIRRRVVPEIAKVHQFRVTRMERYLVGCYAAEDQAHFNAHRDNTTKGTAHRRFAVSINLNSEFEGGEVSFPEYGKQSFKPAPGGAVVFSCSLLHAVSMVTKGRRYAFLPFLYDDEAAKIREANNAFVDEKVGVYKDAR